MLFNKPNLIVDLTFKFALSIVRLTEQLEFQRKYIIASQLLKSGTSIGANVREAQAAESRADFIHKIKLAAKEAEETEYWLMLCHAAWSLHGIEILISEVQQIKRVLGRIITTSKLR